MGLILERVSLRRGSKLNCDLPQSEAWSFYVRRTALNIKCRGAWNQAPGDDGIRRVGLVVAGEKNVGGLHQKGRGKF